MFRFTFCGLLASSFLFSSVALESVTSVRNVEIFVVGSRCGGKGGTILCLVSIVLVGGGGGGATGLVTGGGGGGQAGFTTLLGEDLGQIRVGV